MLTSFVRLLPLAFAFFAALFGSGSITQAFADLQVRGFYMPSYGVNDLVHPTNKAQLASLRAQVPDASHAVLAVHVRVPAGIRSNTVVRNEVSEKPSHLVPWFNLAKKKRLRTGLSTAQHTGHLEEMMTDSSGTLPRFAVVFPRTSRASTLRKPGTNGEKGDEIPF